MQATVLGIPELYIYSKTDELTTFDDLDRLVEDRQSRYRHLFYAREL